MNAISNKKKSVLVIDDDVLLLRATVTVLSKGGFDVKNASTKDQALAMLEKERFDFVLSDIDLPDDPGFSVCNRLRFLAQTDGLPFIFMSGRVLEDIESFASNFGATGSLAKPFPGQVLLQTVRSRLDVE